MPQEVCLNCWHLWRPRSESPRECPRCHSRKITTLSDVVDAVEAVSRWLKKDPLVECFMGDEPDFDELERRFKEKGQNPLDLLVTPFRAMQSVAAFQKVVKNAPLSPKKRMDAREVILEIAGEYQERGDEERIGDFVERYIEEMDKEE